MIPHFFQTIGGWFDYEEFYADMVKRFDSGTFVEVGIGRGRSLAFLCVEVLNSGKPIDVVGVDNLSMWPDQAEQLEKNLKPLLDIGHPPTLILKNSAVAASWVADKSIEFCFIDATHEYDYVMSDIRSWLPKVRPGGIIAGHDFDEHWPDVKRAVRDSFLSRFKVTKNVWWVEV